jgi:chitin disaccharide deacetylase
MKKLIINADDFGYWESVNHGIIECYSNGLVSDLSFIINNNCFKLSVRQLRNAGINDFGIHFNLTLGTSYMNSQSSLNDRTGRFLSAYVLFKKFIVGKLNSDEIYAELKYQLEKILNEGFKITHFDSHQNVHLIPIIFKQLIRLKEEYNLKIPIRVPYEEVTKPGRTKFSNLKRILILNLLSKLCLLSNSKTYYLKVTGGDFYNNKHPEKVFSNILRSLNKSSGEVFELAVHPGNYSDEILQSDPYAHERETELMFLKNMTKKSLSDQVEITSFADIGSLQ